jgi:hypothetical protein
MRGSRIAAVALTASAFLTAGALAVATHDVPDGEFDPGMTGVVDVDDADELAHLSPAVMEQMAAQRAKLSDHQEMIIEHTEEVGQAGLEHEDKMQRELGPRAPVETVAPMATVPPLDD